MLGENIKRIRSERHMTQTALAEKAGVSVQMINQIEWGVKKMSIDTLTGIAIALDCTTDEIIFGCNGGTHGTTDQRAGG